MINRGTCAIQIRPFFTLLLHFATMVYFILVRMMAMKRKPCFLIFIPLLFLTVQGLNAITVQELFRSAVSVRISYSLFKVDLELASLRRTRAEIEAKEELDRLNAEFSYVGALADYRRANLAFFNETLDTVFNVALAELDASIADVKAENANEDARLAQTRYLNGLLSEEGLKESGLALSTVTTDQELAAWTFADAAEVFRSALDRDWNGTLVPQVPDFIPSGTIELWLEKDTTLRRAKLSEKIAILKTAKLAANAAAFDRRIQQAELAKAKVAVTTTENDTRRAFDATVRKLKNQKALLQLRTEESVLKATLARDATRRYESGFAPLSEKNAQRTSELGARKNLLSAQRTYLKTIVEYLVYTDADPMEF